MLHAKLRGSASALLSRRNATQLKKAGAGVALLVLILVATQRRRQGLIDTSGAPQAAEPSRHSASAGDELGRHSAGDKFRVVCTSGVGTYMEWQSRVAFFWYQRAKDACDEELGAACPMGGYTRLLHSGAEDEWMGEIPTVVMPPAPSEFQAIAEAFPVLHRSYALKQWLDEYADSMPEDYIWMGEPDHIFRRAPPLYATPESPAGYPFFYMHPPLLRTIAERLHLSNVPDESAFAPVGNSPVQMHKRQLASIAWSWFNLTAAARAGMGSLVLPGDEGAGIANHDWVADMYAFSIAAATALDHPIPFSLHPEFLVHPLLNNSVVDPQTGLPVLLLHYTYGQMCDSEGRMVHREGSGGDTWHFDKRDWMTKYPPSHYPLPPEGCPNPASEELIRRLNEAAENLPRWSELAGQLPPNVAGRQAVPVGKGEDP